MKKTSFFSIIIIAMVILVGGAYEAETVETAS
ncbi:uncharacterized protein METZ01_LOCUS110831, partial [marine metagenome]